MVPCKGTLNPKPYPLNRKGTLNPKPLSQGASAIDGTLRNAGGRRVVVEMSSHDVLQENHAGLRV